MLPCSHAPMFPWTREPVDPWPVGQWTPGPVDVKEKSRRDLWASASLFWVWEDVLDGFSKRDDTVRRLDGGLHR